MRDDFFVGTAHFVLGAFVVQATRICQVVAVYQKRFQCRHHIVEIVFLRGVLHHTNDCDRARNHRLYKVRIRLGLNAFKVNNVRCKRVIHNAVVIDFSIFGYFNASKLGLFIQNAEIIRPILAEICSAENVRSRQARARCLYHWLREDYD